MGSIDIEIKQPERVAVMRMGYKKDNRFHPDFMAEMMSALDELEANDAVGAVVATGADPKFFSNGLDLEWMMERVGSPNEILGYLGAMNAMFRRWSLYPKPTVAAINGHVFAGGFFMAAHMDFRFMREDRGWACLPEVDINIPLMPGMVAICQAVMPPQSFKHFYYTGKKFTGPESMKLGFIDAVYSEADLLPKCVEFAAELAKKRTRTFAEMKRRIRADIVRIMDEEDPGQFQNTLAFSTPG